MNWTTELIDLYRDDVVLRRESRISQVLGEPPIFPERSPFYQDDKNLRNSNITIELITEEKIDLFKLSEIPNLIFKYYKKDQAKVPYLFQSQLFDSLFHNRFSLIRKGRQLGISDLINDFVLHQVLVTPSNILIIGNKLSYLHDFKDQILAKLRNIPLGFQSGIEVINDLEIKWDNGSRIKLVTKKNVVGQNYDNIIMLDASNFKDLSFVLNQIVPSVSARTQGRIIIEGNIQNKKCFFNDLCSGNKFPFRETIINSLSVPFRDEAWEKIQILTIGLDNYLAEFMCLIPGSVEFNREKNLHQLLSK